MNVVLLIWTGVGGFIAALMGPLVLGSVWNGITRIGALAGFWTGAVVFVLIHGKILSGLWLVGTPLEAAGVWFDFNAGSPYSAATMAGVLGTLVTVVVSLRTEALPGEHLQRIAAATGLDN